MMGLLMAGGQLAERLRVACPSCKGNVFETGDVAGVEEKRQITPAYHIILSSYTPADTSGGDVLWDEVYLVVAVVKNVSKGAVVAGQKEDASVLLSEALAALSGWRLPGIGTVEVVPGPRPKFSDSHAYFPLAFRVKPTTIGVED